jgi:hypothetical protein
MIGHGNTLVHLCPVREQAELARVRADIWTEERLEALAIGELLKHGGSRDDLSRLREYFRKRAEDKYRIVLIPDDDYKETSPDDAS